MSTKFIPINKLSFVQKNSPKTICDLDDLALTSCQLITYTNNLECQLILILYIMSPFFVLDLQR